MMKDVTILTFNEMEKIRQDIDSMIRNAYDASCGYIDAKKVCDWIADDLKEFRKQFE